jgi:hypothetical protein
VRVALARVCILRLGDDSRSRQGRAGKTLGSVRQESRREAVQLSDGLKSADPKQDGDAIMKRWRTTIYHTPRDNMNQPFDFQSAAKAARFVFLVGFEVAEKAESPAWNARDFFAEKFAQKPSRTK